MEVKILIAIIILLLIAHFRIVWNLWEREQGHKNQIKYLEHKIIQEMDYKKKEYSSSGAMDKKFYWDIYILDNKLKGISQEALIQEECHFTMDQVNSLNKVLNEEYSDFQFNINDSEHKRTETLREIRKHLISKI